MARYRKRQVSASVRTRHVFRLREHVVITQLLGQMTLQTDVPRGGLKANTQIVSSPSDAERMSKVPGYLQAEQTLPKPIGKERTKARYVVLRKPMEWGLATRRVINRRCGCRHLFEVIDGESRNRGRNCWKLRMRSGNDMRTAAEAVLIES